MELSIFHLPESIQEMVEVIGLNATLLIVEERGGIRLCVPTRVKDENWLTKLIGKEAMIKLVEYYCGEEIDIPRCASSIKAAQDQKIFEKLKAGVSQAKLAREFGYTERGIRKLKKRLEEVSRYDQVSLF
ncbi:MAG: hypothetical protein HWE39_12905 [Oceanospirillaceae bacterium]|nr:hypothetical protein [Oceanospirillaceae bacterium]